MSVGEKNSSLLYKHSKPVALIIQYIYVYNL